MTTEGFLQVLGPSVLLLVGLSAICRASKAKALIRKDGRVEISTFGPLRYTTFLLTAGLIAVVLGLVRLATVLR